MAANRAFGLVWLCVTLFQVGLAVAQLVMMWWVYEATDSPTIMASMTAFSTVAMLIASPPAGVYVDRLDRRRLLVAVTLCLGIFLLIPAVLLALGRLRVWHCFPVSIAMAVASSFAHPAVSASLPSMVPPESLVRANSALQLTFGLSGVVGPMLGGLMVAAGGEAGALCVTAAILLAAAGCVGLARWSSPCLGGKTGSSMLRELGVALRFIRDQAALLSAVVLTAVLNFAVAPLNVLMPVMARDVLGLGPAGYGTLGSVFSAGMLGGVAALGVKGTVRRKGRLILWSVIWAGVATCAFGLGRRFLFTAGTLVALGVFIGVTNVLFSAALQTLIPDDRRGKVLGALATLNQALRPVALMLVGLLADRFAAPQVIVASGLMLGLSAAVALVFPGIRDVP